MTTLWQRNSDSHYRTVLLALLAGAGAGLAVGMLMAPKSGESLRADIGGAVDDYLDTARHKAEDLRASASDFAQRGLREIRRNKDAAAEKLSSAVSGAVDTGSRQAHEALDSTVSGVNAGADKGHKAIDNAASGIRSASRA